MNVIDYIVEHRSRIMEIAVAHGVTELRLYGSCLARRETPKSDIDFLAIFHPSIPFKWGEAAELMDELEMVFDRRVSIVDSRNIQEAFRPKIETEPINIMSLEAGKEYTISPKSSRAYFYMLNELVVDFNGEREDPLYAWYAYMSLSKQISWWFSKLLRLQDNDLKEYEGFDFIEVLYICDKIEYGMDEVFTKGVHYLSGEIARLKELLPAIKEYIAARLPLYEK